MHQHDSTRERRNQYLYRLGRLYQLSQVTGIESTLLMAYLNRLRQQQEAPQSSNRAKYKHP